MPIVRPPHKSYSLIFDAGLPGDYVAWFIQQHDGFSCPPKFKIREWTPISRKIYETDVELNRYKSFPFEQFIEQELDMGYGDFTKLVFKINPLGHYLPYVYYNFDEIHTKESNITNHIVLEFSENDSLVYYEHAVADEQAKLEETLLCENCIYDHIFDQVEEYKHYKDKFELKGIKVDKVDMGKILFNKDLYEYYRLCLIIDSPPLKDWKEKVDIYQKMCYS